MYQTRADLLARISELEKNARVEFVRLRETWAKETAARLEAQRMTWELKLQAVNEDNARLKKATFETMDANETLQKKLAESERRAVKAQAKYEAAYKTVKEVEAVLLQTQATADGVQAMARRMLAQALVIQYGEDAK